MLYRFDAIALVDCEASVPDRTYVLGNRMDDCLVETQYITHRHACLLQLLQKVHLLVGYRAH